MDYHWSGVNESDANQKVHVQAARTSKMEEKRNFEATLRQQQSLLAQFADNDPERYQHMRKLCLASGWCVLNRLQYSSIISPSSLSPN